MNPEVELARQRRVAILEEIERIKDDPDQIDELADLQMHLLKIDRMIASYEGKRA